MPFFILAQSLSDPWSPPLGGGGFLYFCFVSLRQFWVAGLRNFRREGCNKVWESSLYRFGSQWLGRPPRLWLGRYYRPSLNGQAGKNLRLITFFGKEYPAGSNSCLSLNPNLLQQELGDPEVMRYVTINELRVDALHSTSMSISNIERELSRNSYWKLPKAPRVRRVFR